MLELMSLLVISSRQHLSSLEYKAALGYKPRISNEATLGQDTVHENDSKAPAYLEGIVA